MGKGQSVDALPEHYRNGMPSNVVRRDEWLTAGGAAQCYFRLLRDRSWRMARLPDCRLRRREFTDLDRQGHTGPDGLTRDAVREAGCVDEGSIFADAPTPIRIEA